MCFNRICINSPKYISRQIFYRLRFKKSKLYRSSKKNTDTHLEMIYSYTATKHMCIYKQNMSLYIKKKHWSKQKTCFKHHERASPSGQQLNQCVGVYLGIKPAPLCTEFKVRLSLFHTHTYRVLLFPMERNIQVPNKDG